MVEQFTMPYIETISTDRSIDKETPDVTQLRQLEQHIEQNICQEMNICQLDTRTLIYTKTRNTCGHFEHRTKSFHKESHRITKTKMYLKQYK